jgi:hypothetical protein
MAGHKPSKTASLPPYDPAIHRVNSRIFSMDARIKSAHHGGIGHQAISKTSYHKNGLGDPRPGFDRGG